MSLRLEVIQVARLARTMLGDSSDLISTFLRGQQNCDGGFRGRSPGSDLYYTVFGFDSLTALGEAPVTDRATSFVKSIEITDATTLIDACCLATLWAQCKDPTPAIIFDHIESFRTPDGGYHQQKSGKTCSTYANFMAYRAWSDHGQEPPAPEAFGHAVESLQSKNGGWLNDHEIPIANVPSTAAAISLCRNLRIPVSDQNSEFLLRAAYPAGGFFPFEGAPLPDLLSTAVALHALDGLQVDFSPLRESCLDFVDSLWNAETGGFHGHWRDEEIDVEYTFYGLLALGHLAI